MQPPHCGSSSCWNVCTLHSSPYYAKQLKWCKLRVSWTRSLRTPRCLWCCMVALPPMRVRMHRTHTTHPCPVHHLPHLLPCSAQATHTATDGRAKLCQGSGQLQLQSSPPPQQLTCPSRVCLCLHPQQYSGRKGLPCIGSMLPSRRTLRLLNSQSCPTACPNSRPAVQGAVQAAGHRSRAAHLQQGRAQLAGGVVGGWWSSLPTLFSIGCS